MTDNNESNSIIWDISSNHQVIYMEISGIVDEYNQYNRAFVDTMNLLDKIFTSKSCTENDIAELTCFDYRYSRIAINPQGKGLINDDIFRNILVSTLSEAYEKSVVFFGSENANEWAKKLDEYRNVFLQIYYGNWISLIGDINNLHQYLLVLHEDFNFYKPNFNYTFNFQEVLNGTFGLDLIEQREMVLREIASAKEFCLKNNTDPELEEKFSAKCFKLLDLIELQSSKGFMLNLTYEEIDKMHESDVCIKNSDYTNISDEAIKVSINTPLPETDITLNRQFLALYYLLNEVDKEVFARNKSEIARFIQLLTGKSYDNIYKLTKNPVKDPAERTSKKYQSDIQFVKESFLKLGLNKIAQQIESDNLIG